MSLIKCSKCGREISDFAKVCPHCGTLVNDLITSKYPDNHCFSVGKKNTSKVEIDVLISELSVSQRKDLETLLHFRLRNARYHEAQAALDLFKALNEGRDEILFYKEVKSAIVKNFATTEEIATFGLNRILSLWGKTFGFLEKEPMNCRIFVAFTKYGYVEVEVSKFIYDFPRTLIQKRRFHKWGTEPKVYKKGDSKIYPHAEYKYYISYSEGIELINELNSSEKFIIKNDNPHILQKDEKADSNLFKDISYRCPECRSYIPLVSNICKNCGMPINDSERTSYILNQTKSVLLNLDNKEKGICIKEYLIQDYIDNFYVLQDDGKYLSDYAGLTCKVITNVHEKPYELFFNPYGYAEGKLSDSCPNSVVQLARQNGMVYRKEYRPSGQAWADSIDYKPILSYRDAATLVVFPKNNKSVIEYFSASEIKSAIIEIKKQQDENDKNNKNRKAMKQLFNFWYKSRKTD